MARHARPARILRHPLTPLAAAFAVWLTGALLIPTDSLATWDILGVLALALTGLHGHGRLVRDAVLADRREHDRDLLLTAADAVEQATPWATADPNLPAGTADRRVFTAGMRQAAGHLRILARAQAEHPAGADRPGPGEARRLALVEPTREASP